jgi:hypothetical protein
MGGRQRIGHRLLPKGPVDAARQILLFVGAYVLYQLVRGTVDQNDVAQASWNATKVIDFQRRLHVFVEPQLQQWALHFHWLTDACTWFYLGGNYAITGGALLWIYLRRNDSFYFVRNMFVISMIVALVGYSLFPTAPPRLMPAWGFTDVIQQVTGVSAAHGSASIFVNMYAAIPSMHVCFALMTGLSLVRFSRHWAWRAVWGIYPLLVTFVVIATGNHYLTDAVLGAATAALSALLAKQLLARVRPEVWAFDRRQVQA